MRLEESISHLPWRTGQPEWVILLLYGWPQSPSRSVALQRVPIALLVFCVYWNPYGLSSESCSGLGVRQIFASSSPLSAQ